MSKKNKQKSEFLPLELLSESSILICPKILIIEPSFQMPASSVVGFSSTVESLNLQ